VVRLSYNVTGLSSDTQYVFYVKATDAAGNTSNTNTASQYTTVTGGSFPSNIDSYQSDNAGNTVVTTWDAAASLAFTLASYTIWVRIDNGSFSVIKTGVSSTATSWVDNGTMPGFDYYSRVQAIGTGGQKSPPDADMDDPTILYPPFAMTTTVDTTTTTS